MVYNYLFVNVTQHQIKISEVLHGKSLEIYVGLVGKGFNHCSQVPGFEPWSLAFHGETGGFAYFDMLYKW